MKDQIENVRDITLTKNFRISRKTNSLKFRHFFLQTIEGEISRCNWEIWRSKLRIYQNLTKSFHSWFQDKIKGITSTSVVVSIKQLRGRQFPTNPLGPIKEIMKNDRQFQQSCLTDKAQKLEPERQFPTAIMRNCFLHFKEIPLIKNIEKLLSTSSARLFFHLADSFVS